jgi:AcrR family transcriptional regulator
MEKVQVRILNNKLSVKAQRRASILQAASQVFARKGYETTALDEVAREAGMAKGTLYLYFKDKEALYLQTVLHVLESLESFLVEQVAQQPQALEKLRVFARGQLVFFARNQDTLRLFAALFTPGLANLQKRLIRPLLQKRARLIAYLSALVDEGKRQGGIRRDVESQSIALSFLGMVNQAIHSPSRFGLEGAAVEVPPLVPEQTADTIMRILLEGISSSGERGKMR